MAPATPPESPGDVTLASYEAGTQRYLDHSTPPGPLVRAYLDEVARRVGDGRVLELGSGPGHDADHLESRGVRVLRTDATAAFVERLRAAGHDARLLDVRTDDLGGPYVGVLADAVLLHLTREELDDVLARARRATRAGGVLAFTVKEGDGEGWSHAELDLPRHFTYWREPGLRAALERAGWHVRSLERVAGRRERVAGRREGWLFVIAQNGPAR